MNKVFVIGGTSKIGKIICSTLEKSFIVRSFGSFDCDVRYKKNIQSIFHEEENLYGLIYCSALKSDSDALGDSEELEKLLSVNLFGAVHCLQEAAKIIKKGKIVVLGSVDGTFGNYKKTMYAVSKAALHTYTRCFATQVKEYIETICLVPGTITKDDDSQAIANFINSFMKDDITNIHSQLIRMDKGHHTFPI